MKTNCKIIFPLIAILLCIGSCKDENDPCILSVTIDYIDDPTLSDVTLFAEPKDGLTPYSYHWSTNETTRIIHVYRNNDYASVTVTDDAGCTATASFGTDPCANIKCLNGGTCVNGICQCPTGFTGDSCQLPCRGCTVCGADTTVKDDEGNEYDIVSIGAHCWMAENLRVSAGIPEETDGTQWGSLTSPAWCYYDNNSSNGAIYGKLYNWYAVNTGNLCPSGWHIPTHDEWQDLIDVLGGDATAGGAMKDTTGWTMPNTGATNSSGFTALPGGSRNLSGSFVSMGDYGVFWSSSENSSDQTQAWGRELAYNNSAVSISNSIKARGYSCRCVKD